MPRIFLSYTSKNRQIMEVFKKHLEDAGFKVWSDPDIRAGEDFSKVINEQLENSDAIITLWSRESVRAKWVYFEALMAARMKKAFPIMIDKSCVLPEGVKLLQCELFDLGSARLSWWKARPDMQFDLDLVQEHFDSQRWRTIVERLSRAVSGPAQTAYAGTLEELTWNVIEESDESKNIEDFIERYPNGKFHPAAQKALDTLRPRNRRRLFLWGALTLITYIGLLLPYSGLWHDYPSSGVRLWSMLYFNFFMFFVIFGVFMVPVYYFTLFRALSFSRAKKFFRLKGGSTSARLVYLAILVLAPLILSSVVSYMEVSSGYAPWQFSEGTLQTPINTFDMQGVKIDTLPGQPGVKQETRSLEEIFGQTRSLPLRTAWQTRDLNGDDYCLAAPPGSPAQMTSSDCSVHMNNLQRVMTHVMTNAASRSRTGYLYTYSFFFFALMFMGTYVNIFFITRFPRQMSTWLARLSPWSSERYSQLLKLLGLQLAFISVWFVGRMMFQLETNTILPGSGGTTSTQAIRSAYYFFLAVYLAAAGFVIAAAFRMNNFRTRVAVILTAVFTTLFLGFAFMGSSFLQVLQRFIGPQANAASTVILSIVVVVILAPMTIPNFFSADEEELVYPSAISADNSDSADEPRTSE